jgi:non-ribosomal peptide synthetase component F
LVDHGAALFRFLDAEASRVHLEPANLQYWRESLEGVALASHAGADLAWAPGTIARWHVDGDALSTLLVACHAQRCSAFVAVLAAEVSLLADLSGTDDLVVNVPVSNRTSAGEHAIVANLSHLLHLRFRIVPSETPRDFLRRVRNQVMEAMAHRQYDYASLSAALAADAAERGGALNWLNGCNYIRGSAPTPAHAALFEERFDDQAESYDVPETAFTLTCHHVSDSGSLRFHVDWDGHAWSISADDLRARFLDALSTVTGATRVASRL